MSCTEKENKIRKYCQCREKEGYAFSLYKHLKKCSHAWLQKTMIQFFSQKTVPCWKSLKIPQGELELESKAKHKDTSLKPNPLAHLKCSCSFWSEKHSTRVVLSVLLAFLGFSIPNNSNIWTSINTTKTKPANLLLLPLSVELFLPFQNTLFWH